MLALLSTEESIIMLRTLKKKTLKKTLKKKGDGPAACKENIIKTCLFGLSKLLLLSTEDI